MSMSAAAPQNDASPVFRDTLPWYLGMSSYWFATSLKWFILFLILPLQVSGVVPAGAKNTTWGLVVAFGAVEAMIGPALFGYWSDRTASRWGKRRPFLAIGAALTALAALYLGRASSLPMMVIGYLFLQISDDVATGPYAAVVPDLVPEERRGRASGILSLLGLVAQIAAAVIGIALGDIFKIYVAIAIINLVCAVIVLVTVRERPSMRSVLTDEAKALAGRASDAVPTQTNDLLAKFAVGAKNWLAPFQNADFRWVWLTRFLVAFGFYLILIYAVNYLTDSVKVFKLPFATLTKPKDASIVLALAISLSGAVASVIAGKLADTWGRKRVIILSGWLMFGALVPFAFVRDYGVILLLALVFGFGYGAYLSASWALASDILPNKEDSAKDMGIWQMSVATPQILTGAAGALVDWGNRVQPGNGFGYTLAFLLSAFAFLAGSLLVRRVKGST